MSRPAEFGGTGSPGVHLECYGAAPTLITQANAPAQSSLFGLIDRCRLTQFETVFELVKVVGMCVEETAQPRRVTASGVGCGNELLALGRLSSSLGSLPFYSPIFLVDFVSDFPLSDAFVVFVGSVLAEAVDF